VDQPGWAEARKVAARPYATATAACHDEAKSLSEAALSNRENTVRVLDGYMASLQRLRDQIGQGDAKSVAEFLEDAVKARNRWLDERTRADWQTVENVEAQSFGDKLSHMFFGSMMERTKKRK
jgi:hypothetical protein